MGISVIMSVYKSEESKYLDSALKSVWTDQTLKPNQVILIEDGPLGSELCDVIKKWQDAMGDVMLIMKNSENLGLTKSLNKAISAAKCDYLARMDSDDISMPDRFRVQSEYLDKHPDIDILGGSLQEFDEDNECLLVRNYPTNPADSKKCIHKASPLAHPTVMMRKKIFDEGLSYNEMYRTSQDIALWFDAICKGYNISNVQDVTILFRRAGNVFKRRGRAKAFNEFKIYMKGIYRMNGVFTPKYVYPMMRLVFRFMPESVVKFFYGSVLRKRILEKK